MGTKYVFQNKVVQSILLSNLLVQVGIWIRNFAILLYVMDMTGGDPFAVAMISVAEFAPIFVFSLVGGAYADRWPPKRTMVCCELLSAGSVFAVLGAFIFNGWQTVFFVTLISAILSQFSQPSGLKLFKMHLPMDQLQPAMSAYQTIFAIFMIVGPMLGTLVYQNLGIYIAIAAVGAAFLLAAAALCYLPPDQPGDRRKAGSSLRAEIAGGFSYVYGNKVLVMLSLIFVAAGLALGLTQPLGIFLVTEQLGLAKESLQWLLMSYGAGMVLGGVLTMALSKKLTSQQILIAGLAGFAVGYLVIGWSKILLYTLLAHFFVGMMLPGIESGVNTLMLQNTEEAFVGRVNGILNPLFFGAMVLTMSIAGAIKYWLPLAAIFGIAAVLFAASLLAVLPIYHLSLENKRLN